jgi:hypothetical protein
MAEKPDSKQGSNPEALGTVAPVAPRVPNPRRVLAGRMNRQKRGEITPEGKEKLRQTALCNRPWMLSTGPKTAHGRATVARNGKARQKGPTSVREARREARAVRYMIQEMRQARQPQL